jgi:hypothetical protein
MGGGNGQKSFTAQQRHAKAKATAAKQAKRGENKGKEEADKKAFQCMNCKQTFMKTTKRCELVAHADKHKKTMTFDQCFPNAPEDPLLAAKKATTSTSSASKVVAVARPRTEFCCAYKKCTFLKSSDAKFEGYCCGACKKSAPSRVAPNHGPLCGRIEATKENQELAAEKGVDACK